jgi:Na+/proline symporter
MLFTLVWLYTRRGGIKTLVWTDTLQTLCMLAALIIIMWDVIGNIGPVSATDLISHTGTGSSPIGFLLSFVSGAFIVVVMTGLDQDMMQKNLTCKSLRDAQKDMCTYGFAFLPVNALFLVLGSMLVMLCNQQGTPLPSNPDGLLIGYAVKHVPVIFLIGILATSFSTVDSSLTALTTSFCIDICERPDDERLRKTTHLVMALLLAVCVFAFSLCDTSSLIDVIYTLVGYSYGPLLGLFAFALFHHARSRYAPAVCIAAPIVSYLVSYAASRFTSYHMGYELLMLNGLLTYLGLYVMKELRAKN